MHDFPKILYQLAVQYVTMQPIKLSGEAHDASTVQVIQNNRARAIFFFLSRAVAGFVSSFPRDDAQPKTYPGGAHKTSETKTPCSDRTISKTYLKKWLTKYCFRANCVERTLSDLTLIQRNSFSLEYSSSISRGGDFLDSNPQI